MDNAQQHVPLDGPKAVKDTTGRIPFKRKRSCLVVLRQYGGGSLIERCREIIMSDWTDGNIMTPAGHTLYDTNQFGKETRISSMLPTSVKRYVL